MSFFPLQACEELSIVSLLTLFEYSRPRLSSYAKAIINKTECGVLLRYWDPHRKPPISHAIYSINVYEPFERNRLSHLL